MEQGESPLVLPLRARLMAKEARDRFPRHRRATVRDGKVADVYVFYWDRAPILEA
jgi:hypothetical protein